MGRDKQDATGRELARIARAAGELHYDESPVWGARPGDLALEMFAAYHEVQYWDYSLSGSQIRVFVFTDRVEVRSPGRLPNSVTLDNIRLGFTPSATGAWRRC